jgi:hypothetical protein
MVESTFVAIRNKDLEYCVNVMQSKIKIGILE